MLNPATLGIMMYPWKDVTFSVFAMLSMTYAVNVYFSERKWLNKRRNIFMFVASVSSAAIFRHNAVLFSLPLLFAVLFYADRKQKFILITSCCAFVLIVRGILYPYLEVKKPGHRIVETTLLPMTIITEAVHEAPGKMDQDIPDFIHEVIPEDNLRDNYSTGNFNSIKFKGISADIIEDAGYCRIFGMIFRCFKKAPLKSLRGLAALTDMVYGISGSVEWKIVPGISENDLGIENNGISLLQFAFKGYSALSRAFLKHLFWHTGILILAVIVFILAKVNFRDKHSLRKLLFAVPVLTYDFGTMFFPGGNDFRFFFGAGPAGLTAAYELLRNAQGHEVIVF